MREGAYVGEALVYESFKKGSINLIYANCGAGKTTAVFETIPQRLGIAVSRSLFLINTSVGRDDNIFRDRAKNWEDINEGWGEDRKEKPTIMTYQKFGSLLKKDEIRIEDYDYIVCDEIHDIIYPVQIERGRLKKMFPQSFPWEINDMLKMTCFNYIAIEAISDAAKAGEKWIIGLTATPQSLEKIQQFNNLINEVKFSQALRAYEIISSFEYTDIEDILRRKLPDGRKRAFFFNTIKELKKYKKILIEAGRKAEALWSMNETKQPMDAHQYATLNTILTEYKLPDDVQDLLFNSSMTTAITIKDDAVKEFYNHTGNETIRTQARNRFRQDMEVVGNYNSETAKNKNKEEKRKEELYNQEFTFPEKYLNVPLGTEDKKAIIKELGIKGSWTTLKKLLEEQGYRIEEKKITKKGSQKRFSIISRRK